MLSSAFLQIIAFLTMLIDHAGYYFFPNCDTLRIIGRIAFPLFALLLAEGIKHTRSKKNYFLRLLFFALITQIVSYFLSNFYHDRHHINVLFSFCIAFASIILIEKSAFFWPLVIISCLSTEFFNLDYGFWGIMLIIAFYFVQKIKNNYLRKSLLALAIVVFSLAMFHDYGWIISAWTPLCIPLIVFYSGKKGRRLPKYLGYSVYPAHLLLILIIGMLIY